MEIDVMFKAWADHAEKMETAAKAAIQPRPKPLWKALGTANTPSAATTQTLILGGPAAGRMWFIHRVGVFGSDGHSAAAGTVDVFSGPGQESNQVSQIYSGLTIPTIIVEGMDTNPVMPNERVYAIFTGLAAQQVVQFSALVEDYPLSARVATGIG